MHQFSKRRLLIRVTASILLILLASCIFMERTQSNARQKIFVTLAEISEQGIARLQLELSKSMDKLTLIADIVEAEPEIDPTDMLKRLKPLSEKYGFKRMGLADVVGNVQTTDGGIFDITDRDFFQKSLRGQLAISGVLTDRISGGDIIVYSVPIFSHNKVAYVLFCTYDIGNYSQALSAPSYSGAGYSYIVTGDGACVIGSDRQDSVGLKFRNLFSEYMKYSPKNARNVDSMRANMAAGGSGGTAITAGTEKLLYYQPIGVNEWFLITVVPAAVAMRETNQILLWSYLFVIVCSVVMVFLLIDSLRTRLASYHKLENVAYVDALTGGSTFLKFRIDVQSILAAHPADNFVMISLDVNNFQYINDVYGYEEGDTALRFLWMQLANRLSPLEACSRVYGDHFVCLARYQNDFSELLPRFENAVEALHEYHPSHNMDEGYNFSISAGVYPIKDITTDVDTMVNRARIPQKLVKGRAASTYAVYTDVLHDEIIRGKLYESRFQTALESEEFQVYYQPKYDLHRKAFYGAEALVRWQTPDGLLLPGAFIPIFERNGDIVSLDLYMLEHVCQDLRRWINAGLTVSPVSVNVSHLQLLRQQFVPDYLEILQRYSIPASLIEVEFTETMMVRNVDRLTCAAEELHAAQMRVLIDDFGSGYSSLSMLKNVSLDVLKLDGSFMRDLETDKKAQDVVIGGLALGHTLGMTITAEGVETAAQLEFLRRAGCDAIQGFYCARPMTRERYETLLREAVSLQPKF